MDKIIATATTVTSPQLYKEFFKLYYKEKTRALVIITSIIGGAAVLFGLYAMAEHLGIFYTAIPLAAGLVLLIKPRYAYRKPFNSAKNNKITTKFEFYEDRLIEKNASSQDEFLYSSLYKLRETDNYIYIYHDRENVSIVDKNKIKQATADELSKLLKSKIPY